MIVKSSSLTVFYLAFHNNAALSATFHAHIEAARSFEAHLVRIDEAAFLDQKIRKLFFPAGKPLAISRV